MSVPAEAEHWLLQFKSEYRRRTGITLEDGGMSDEEAVDYYYPDTSPGEAVQHQIDKYGLIDITDPAWGGL